MAILIRSNVMSDSVVPPAPGVNWITPTFQNSWVNFGGDNPNAGYYKDSLGFTHLQGVVKSGTLNVPIFTLPAGYRPKNNLILSDVAGGSFSVLQVGADGTVNTAGPNSYATLNNITFKAEL